MFDLLVALTIMLRGIRKSNVYDRSLNLSTEQAESKVRGRCRLRLSLGTVYDVEVILQGFGDKVLSAVGHVQGMTKPWEPVWQCRRCNSRLSAGFDCFETMTRNDPRPNADYDNRDKNLNKRVLLGDEGE